MKNTETVDGVEMTRNKILTKDNLSEEIPFHNDIFLCLLAEVLYECLYVCEIYQK